MKKGIIFGVVCIAVLFIATFAACNSNEEPIVGNQRDTIVMSNPEFSTLLSQIENLNKSYTSMSSRSGDDGSKNGNNMSARDSADIVQLADDMGNMVGSGAAFAASGAVSIPGSPAAGVALSLLLGFAMSEAGAQLFSSVASMCIGYQIVTPKNGSGNEVRYDTNLKLEISTSDKLEISTSDKMDLKVLQSVGKRHNLFMVKSHKKYSKYSKKELQSEKMIGVILDDCIAGLKDAYKEYGELEYSDNFKKHLISVTMDMLQILDDSHTQPGMVNRFSTRMQSLLINKYGYDEEKVLAAVKFEKLISDGCNEIDSEKIDRYSSELSKTINQSELTTIEKANLLTGAQVAVNSRLCWAD